MKRARLIWNPAAGRVNMAREVREAAGVLKTAGWNLSLTQSQNAAQVTELAREAAQAGWEAVFVAGGDGTLGGAVAGLMGSDTALGVLPTGTTNVWAKEIGLQAGRIRLVDNARHLSAGKEWLADIGLCNEKPFMLWAGFGLDARVIERLERRRNRLMKFFNEIYYLATIWRCAVGWRGIPVQITADGQPVEGWMLQVLACNIRYYAGSILSPHSKWDDAKLELWALRSGSKGGVGTVIRHLWNLGYRQHVRENEVVCLPFRQAHITFKTEEWMHLDGEPYGTIQQAHLAIRAKALKVLVPETRPEPTSTFA